MTAAYQVAEEMTSVKIGFDVRTRVGLSRNLVPSRSSIPPPARLARRSANPATLPEPNLAARAVTSRPSSSRPQPQHSFFRGLFNRVETFDLLHLTAGSEDVSVQVGPVLEPSAVKMGGRRRPQPKVLAPAPVHQVVETFVPAAGKVGYLVMGESAGREQRSRLFE